MGTNGVKTSFRNEKKRNKLCYSHTHPRLFQDFRKSNRINTSVFYTDTQGVEFEHFISLKWESLFNQICNGKGKGKHGPSERMVQEISVRRIESKVEETKITYNRKMWIFFISHCSDHDPHKMTDEQKENWAECKN